MHSQRFLSTIRAAAVAAVISAGAKRTCSSSRDPLTKARKHLPASVVVLAMLLLFVPTAFAGLPSTFHGPFIRVNTGSQFTQPIDVATDSQGDVFVLDKTTGYVTELAAVNGSLPASPVMNQLPAGFTAPTSIAIDKSGNLFVVAYDSTCSNNSIYEMTAASGYGTTTALTSVCGASNNPQSVRVDASGNLFFTDNAANQVSEVHAPGYTSVNAVISGLTNPKGIAVDASDNIFVADQSGSQIWEYTASSVYAQGSRSSASAGIPYSFTALNLALDASGNLYLGSGNQYVFEVQAAGGYSSVANLNFSMSHPAGITLDSLGNIFVADQSAAVYELPTAVNLGSIPFGSTTALTQTLQFSVYGNSSSINSITVLTQGLANKDFTQDVNSTCSNTTSNTVCAVQVDFLPTAPGLRRGVVLVQHTVNGVSQTLPIPVYGVVDAPQVAINPGTASVVSPGETTVNMPGQIALDSAGNMYVTEQYTGGSTPRLLKIPAGGGSYTDITPSISSTSFYGIAMDGAGNYYISDPWGNGGGGGIIAVTASGQATSLNITGPGSSLSYPQSLAMDVQGNLYIADSGNARVLKVILQNPGTSSVSGTSAVVSAGDYSFQSYQVPGVAVDVIGNVYIADKTNQKIVKVTPSGGVSTLTFPASAALAGPIGVAVDGFGNVYVTNEQGRDIVEQTPDGATTVLSLAGLSSGLINPFSSIVDPNGKVFISDSSNDRIVKVDPTMPYAASFASTLIGATSSDSSLTYTVTNLGDRSLSITGLSYPADFPQNSEDTNLCASSTTLSAGASCDVSINFTPTAPGSLSESITLTDNNYASATQTIAASGTGLSAIGQFGLVIPNTVTAGTPVAMTLTAEKSNGATLTNYTGTVNLSTTDSLAVFSLSSGGAAITSYTFQPGDAGVKTLYVTFKSETFDPSTGAIPNFQTVTAADGVASISTTSGQVFVNPGPVTTISTSYCPTPVVAQIGSSFTCVVSVTDAYGNAIPNDAITISAPTSGAGIIPLATGYTTATNGYAIIQGNLNLTAGGPYTVTIATADLVGSPLVLTYTNQPAATTTTLIGAPASPIAYGTSIALTATVTPGATQVIADVVARNFAGSGLARPRPMGGVPSVGVRVGPPTGTVSFYDTVGSAAPRLLGSVAIGSSGSVAQSSRLTVRPMGGGSISSGSISGTAALTIATPLAGTHNYTAVYTDNVDSNFTGSSTATALPYTVTPGTVTLSGPGTQPVRFAAGVSGSIGVTATGSVAGANIALPSGSLSYTIMNGNSASVGSGSAALAAGNGSSLAVIPVPGSLVPGSYTIAITYAGDGNFAASTSPATVTFTIPAATAGSATAPVNLMFGSQILGTTSSGQALIIQNTGTSALAISNPVTTGDFATTGNCATIPAGTNCTLTVTFTPSATGNRTGTVTLSENAGGNTGTQTIQVSGWGTQPGATLSTGSETFPGTLLGSTSPALTATLTNSGSSVLSGIAISVVGDFSETTTCGASLDAGATCTITTSYAPTISGTETGSLNISDNLGAQSIVLSGTGLTPGASLNTSALLFGGQLVGATSRAQTVVFTNTGTGAVTFTSSSISLPSNFSDTTNCSGSIAAGKSCSINVVFTPATTGALNGTLTLTDSAGTQSVPVSGVGIGSVLSITPSFVIFGSQQQGTVSQAQTVVVGNKSSNAVTLGTVKVTNNFAENDTCSGTTLSAGANCTISVGFAPSAVGTLSGSLTVNSSDNSVSTVAALQGQGAGAGISVQPSIVSFGSQPVGAASQAQIVTIWNSGTSAFTIGNMTASGDFTETDTCSGQTIAAGTNCVISIIMTPTTSGMRTGSIQFTESIDGLQVVSLSGVGEAAGVSLSTDALAFGSLPIAGVTTGTSQTVVVTNSGSGALDFTSIQTVGDFRESDNCGSAVSPGKTCTITVTFVPTALGHRTGTLTLNSNASDQQVVSLAGDGSPVGLTLTPPILNFGQQTVGNKSGTLTAVLSNNTGRAINNMAVSASGEYAESDNCSTSLANGSSCTLQITVTPTTIGAITGTISVSSNGVTVFGSATTRETQTNLDRPGAKDTAAINSNSNIGTVATAATTIPANAAKLAFGAPPAVAITAGGNAGSVAIIEEDGNGNLVSAADTITLTVTGPNSYSKSYTATATAGGASFNLGNAALTSSGAYSYSVAVSSNTSISSASAQETVSAGQASVVNPQAGSGQSAKVNAAFATALTVKVVDAYGNAVSGATVAFTAPASGAGATLSAASVLTNSSGMASITATANAIAGNYNVTAAVNGAASVSFSLTNNSQTPVVDFTLTATPSTSPSIAPGQLMTYALAIQPTVGASLPNATTLTIAGLPAGASASIALSPWTQLSSTSWQLPANTTFATIPLVVTTSSAAEAANQHPGGSGLPKLAWGLLLLPFAARIRKAGRRLSSGAALMLGLLALAGAIGLSGCGAKSSGYFGQPPASYTLTVTATSGNLSHSATVTLNVE